jgi:hypothetical protein
MHMMYDQTPKDLVNSTCSRFDEHDCRSVMYEYQDEGTKPTFPG